MNDLLREKDYSFFAGGQVCYHLPGTSALSIKLAETVFNECIKLGKYGRELLAICDPCCGSAYHFVALGYIFWDKIRSITCSDSDPAILEIARKNLNLLTADGLKKRIGEIEEMIIKFKKDSHVINKNHALKLLGTLLKNLQDHAIETMVFSHNIIDSALKKNSFQYDVDIVLSDVPYGNLSKWVGADDMEENTCIVKMLDNLYEITTRNTILAIIASKKVKVGHPQYRVIKKMKIGKRKIFFLKKAV